jgi:2-dehydro-3-deoxyphosphogluconate aldolase/(4S)-4-hydroxy-2-oxoglutarate aldolase
MSNNTRGLDFSLVAIIRTGTVNEAREYAKVLLDAQVESIEFTTTTPGVFDLIEEFASDKKVRVGLGTAMTKEHVLNAKKAGAQFVISPHTSKEVIEATK